ncbi:metal-dependent hydrolase [Campylobacter sp. MOP51]|uniref:metal-dependent hydrolase n=1 Tax=Campylobacter canis TaxID=3378588 RepID=UPI003C46979E
MLKNSHQMIGLCATPLTLTAIPYTGFELIDHLISKHNAFFYSIFSSSNQDNNLLALAIYIISVFFGSTLPDCDIGFRRYYPPEQQNNMKLYHRQWTHSVLLWTILWILGIFVLPGRGEASYFYLIFMGIVTGGISHIVADAFTGTIPWGFFGSYEKKYSRIGTTNFLSESTDQWFKKELPVVSDTWLFLYIPVMITLSVLAIISR